MKNNHNSTAKCPICTTYKDLKLSRILIISVIVQYRLILDSELNERYLLIKLMLYPKTSSAKHRKDVDGKTFWLTGFILCYY